MKYAVVSTGGKQYKVSPEDIIEIEKIKGEKGDKIELDNVLMLVDEGEVLLGQPKLENVKAKAEIIEQKKGPKIRVAKFRAKSRYRKVKGHRQQLTKVKIDRIIRHS